MRRGLLALLVLLGSSPAAFAQAQPQFLTSVAPAPATTRVSIDEVVARIMTFDQNHDGRVSVGELSERMRPLVDRGDKDGDRALDRSEILALSRAPSTQVRAAFPGSGGYGFGEDSGFSSRLRLEGALEDLRLTADKTERALPLIHAYVEQTEAAARTELLGQLEPLLTLEQLATITQLLNNQTREVAVRTNVGGADTTRVLRLPVNADLARRVDQMGIEPGRSNAARKAIDDFKSRIRLEREADRAALLAQLRDILSSEELSNFSAAIQRRPVVASGGALFAGNGIVINAREFVDVARPAVLIERAFPANGATR